MAQQQCYTCGTVYEIGRRQCHTCGSVLLLHNRYIVRRVLGRGGFAIVYEALDTRVSNRRVAIKKVSNLSPDEQQTIITEVEVLAGNASRFGFVPSIYDILRETKHTYIVMEYISGPTLNDMPRPWQPCHVEYFLHVMLRNLEQLHSARIIHRDLKPANIKYTPNGRAPYTVLDFGISKYGKGRSLKAVSPEFSAPEQTRNSEEDVRSDIFSLGATAYYLLTDLYLRQAMGIGNGNIPSPIQLGVKVGAAVDKTIFSMLSLDPYSRPPTAAAARELLGSFPTQYTPANYLPSMPPHITTQSSETQDICVAVTPPSHSYRYLALSLPVLLISGGGATLLLLLFFVMFAFIRDDTTSTLPSTTNSPTQSIRISIATATNRGLNNVEQNKQNKTTRPSLLVTSTPILPPTTLVEPIFSNDQVLPTLISTSPTPINNPELFVNQQQIDDTQQQSTNHQEQPSLLPTILPPTELPILLSATESPVPLVTEPPTPQLVTVPNIVGALAGEAYSILSMNGLQGTDFSQSVSGCAPFTVMSQELPAGAKVQGGSTVIFGVCPQGPLVPLVVELQIEDARAMLAAAGFTVVEITYGDRRYPNDYVGDQIPSAGQPAPDGIVTLSIVSN